MPVCPQRKGDVQKQRKKWGNQGHPTCNAVHGEESEASSEEEIHSIFTLAHKRIKPIKTVVSINGVSIEMEIDTGASLSIINEKAFEKLQNCDPSDIANE